MKSFRRILLPVVGSASMILTLTAVPTEVPAQDESGDEIISTDGLVQYGDADEMWNNIGEQWEALSAKAVNRWDKVDAQRLIDTQGERAQLVEVVTDVYDITPAVAGSEVDAWALSLNATE